MATKQKNEVVEASEQLPGEVIDYGDDCGDGLQDVGRDEAGIPFLKILQAQSPEVVGPEGKLDGAAAGLILNTGTEQLSESVTIVPAIRQHVFVEWRPRRDGGGIVGIYQPDDPVVTAAVAANAKAIEDGTPSRKPRGGVTRFGEFYTELGNDLVETFYVFAVILEDDEPAGFVVVPFASTQIKAYKKKFMNRVRNYLHVGKNGKRTTPPMYAHRVTLTAGDESNSEGTWKGYVIRFANDNNVKASLMAPDHAGYQAAKALHDLVKSGDAQADTSKAGDAATDPGAEDDAAF